MNKRVKKCKKLKKCKGLSKENILKDYPRLPPFYKKVISKLFGDSTQKVETYKFRSDEIVNIDGCNKPRVFGKDELGDKVGVYIFANKDCKPVYIGLAGKGEKSEHSLYGRLQKQLNALISNSTIAKNIKEIEGILQNKNRIKTTKEKNGLKQLILEYAPNIFVIPTGKY